MSWRNRSIVLGFRRQVAIGRRGNKITRYFSAQPVAIKGTIPVGGKDVAASQFATVERSFTEQDIFDFGTLVNDRNSLHTAWKLEELPSELEFHPMLEDMKSDDTNTKSTKPIVHGMLASSLFSCIFGTLVPGAVYLKQTLDFRSPIYANEPVVGRVDVVRVRQFKAKGIIVTCETNILRKETHCISGKADVWLPGGTKAVAS